MAQFHDLFVGRRNVLRWAGMTLAGSLAGPLYWPLKVGGTGKARPLGTARHAIMIEMSGAISPMDCWDLKETRWTPKDLEPKEVWPGLSISQTLFPKFCASRMLDRVSLVRSMRAKELVHLTGQYHVQAGRALNVAVAKEIPAFGSVIAAELDSQRRDSDTFPTYMSTNLSRNSTGVIGTGFLPTRFSGVDLDTSVVLDAFGGKDGGTSAQLERRWRGLRQLGEVSPGGPPLGDKASQYETYYDYAYRILKDARWPKIFQLRSEETQRYGAGHFGLGCLLARNLLQTDAGTRFVYISDSIGGNGPWDHHTAIYDRSRPKNLYAQCWLWDQGFTALLEDLGSAPGHEPGRSLLDETLIIATSEFGRTPTMNTGAGRDHYAKTFTSLLAGGGVKGRRILGKTNQDCSECIDTGWKHRGQPVIDNLVATIYSALGIDWSKTIENTPSGRSYEYVQTAPIGSSEFIAPDPIEDLFS